MEQRKSIALKAKESQEIVFQLTVKPLGYADPIVAMRFAGPTRLDIKHWQVTPDAAVVTVYNPSDVSQAAEVVCDLLHPPDGSQPAGRD